MPYEVIARKWRPQKFDDVVGQQTVTRTLRNALASGRLAQAFVFAGPAVLSYLTRETAKIRSTQSATGILYVDFFTVVVGEVLAKYILLATRVAV